LPLATHVSVCPEPLLFVIYCPYERRIHSPPRDFLTDNRHSVLSVLALLSVFSSSSHEPFSWGRSLLYIKDFCGNPVKSELMNCVGYSGVGSICNVADGWACTITSRTSYEEFTATCSDNGNTNCSVSLNYPSCTSFCGSLAAAAIVGIVVGVIAFVVIIVVVVLCVCGCCACCACCSACQQPQASAGSVIVAPLTYPCPPQPGVEYPAPYPGYGAPQSGPV
jgi:hypothetical protein